MAHYWSEGVSTLRFTAREFQQELVEEGLKHNLLTCPPSSAASFVSLKLIQELAYQIRRPQKRRTVILTQLHRLKKMAFELSHLTDLQTIALSYTQDCADFNKIVSSYEIIVCSSEILDFLFEENLINLSLINLLVIEQCHMVVEDASLQKIMSRYTNEKKQSLSSEFLPRILAFTHPLFTNYSNDTITKNTNKVKRVFDQYSNDLPLDRATILDAKNTSSQSNEQTGIECLKTFTDLQCLDVDKETMEMNSFQYWSTPHDNFLNNDVIVDNDIKDPNKLKETLNDEEELNISKSEGSAYDILECHLEKLEKILCCKADMASDIVGLKRITGKPKEVIIECKAISDEDKCSDRVQLENFMKITAVGSLKFLEDHRYDPTEIYGDDLFSDELRAIPDPRTEPKEMLELFLYVLEQAGPYAADKAAFSLLIKIEKLKIKIPYERHFLLLCLVTSTLIQIRAATDLIFEKYLTDREKIRLFSTPKVLRLMDVLKLFKPSEINQRSTDVSPKFTKYNIEMKPDIPLSNLENKGESLSNAPLKVLKNSQHTGSSEKNNCDIKKNSQNQKELNSVTLLEDDGKQKRMIEKFNSKEGLELSKDKIVQVTEDIIIDDSLQIDDSRINSVSNHKGEQNKILNALDNLSESPLEIKKMDDSNILLNEEFQKKPRHKSCEFVQNKELIQLNKADNDSKGRNKNLASGNSSNILFLSGNFNDTNLDLKITQNAINTKKLICLNNTLQNIEFDFKRLGREIESKYNNISNLNCSENHANISGDQSMGDILGSGESEAKQCSGIDNLKEGNDCTQLKFSECTAFDKLKGISKTKDNEGNSKTPSDSNFSSNKINVPLDNESICKIDSCENANSEKNKANLNKCNVSNTNNEGNQEKKALLFTNKSDSVKILLKDSPTKKYDNFRGRGKGRGGKGYGYQGRYQHGNSNDPDALCGLIFVEESLIAKILSTIINEYCRTDENLKFICAQYTVDKVADPLTDSKEAETEHRLQEEVLKRFRIHECNLLVGTSFLEEGMDLPKCNLVIRWDIPKGYRSYARCRARARAPRSLYALLALPPSEPLITTLANYTHIERMLVRKCGWREPPASEEADAVRFSALIESYRPSGAAVNLSSAVGLLNRYCAKLPSDTFTRLVPLWSMERIFYQGICLYVCTIRLPINCPLKHHIVGHPMPNRVLARRIAALQACKALHRAGELDDNLMPIGKEGFRAMESDWLSVPPQSDLPKLCDSSQVDPHGTQLLSDFEPRPGTTKRKQYYYKKVAQALTDCRPIVGQPCLAYQINAWLACPLPERHNTRGRKLHPPEAYAEGFAILTSKPIQQIPVFPIFTRSGEVRVALQRLPGGVILSRHREKLIHNFMKYTFAEVLRVHNHLMIFDDFGKQSRNSYYVVPTHKATEFKGVNTPVAIDWNFLQLIYDQTNSNSATSIVTKSPFFDNSCVNLPDKTQNKGAKNVKSDDLNGKKKLMKEECFAENGNIETISNSLDIKTNQQSIELFQNNIECVKNTTECNKATVEIKCRKNEVVDCKKNIVVVEKLKSNLTIDKGIEINESSKNTNHVVKNEIYNGDKLKDESKSTTLIESTKDTSLNICNFKKSCICVKCKKALIGIKKDNTNITDVTINNESKDQSVEDDAVNVEEILPNPYLAPGEAFVFDSEKFRDAVVMPWYRNQDQPQYFYVAEICWHLSPCSAFPSAQHSTFEQYYKQKYGVKITQTCQPLLDVDHTSARLNLLTPRFVNRKGVALPTSSERTKRAKRESLEQKQILVPELCCAHPFRGALWRAAVALPCVLYRINSLLLADEIRRSVALCVALGIPKPNTKFEWPPLDFGWSLAEVLAGDISKESKADIINIDFNQSEEKIFIDGAEIDSIKEDATDKQKTANDLLKEKEDADERTSIEAFEIGTWSNDMAASVPIDALEIHDYEDDELISATSKLPGNLTICTSMEGGPDWSLSGNELSSPQPIPSRSQQRKYSMADSDASYVSSEFDISEEDSSSSDADSDDVDTNANSTDTLSEKGGIRIEYKAGNEAEAIEVATIPSKEKKNLDETIDIKVEKDAEEISMKAFHSFFYKHDNEDSETIQYVKEFRECIASNERSLKNNGILVKYDHNMEHLKPQSLATSPYHMDNISLKITNKPVSKCDLYHENSSNLGSISKDNKFLHDREVSKVCVDYKDKLLDTDLSEKKIIALSEMNSSKINANKEIEKNDLRSNTEMKCSYSDEYRWTNNKCDKLISMNDDENLNEIDPYVEDDNVNPFPESFEMALSKEESLELYREMFPYLSKNLIESEWYDHGLMENGSISLDNLERNKRKILNDIKASMPKERWMKLNLFGMKDLDEIDYENNILTFNANNSENSNVLFKSHYDESQKIGDENQQNNHNKDQETTKNVDDKIDDNNSSEFSFSFDFQPDLYNHPGPSPSLILQALTMSNANDGINLERLETIGDSFLKYAITTYLYCTYQNIHEGKLSHLRSKQVSNLNLYRLGRRKSLGSRMVAYKFEPHDNWLPPCHRVPPHLERALIDTHIPSSLWNIADMPPLIGLSKDEIEKLVREKVTHYHTVPSKYNNLIDRRIKEDENCIFHGKYSKLVRDLTISCCESISKLENNEQNKNTEQSTDGNEDTKMIKEQKLKTSFENACDNVVVNNLNNNLKDGTYKCTCTIISNGSDQQKKADIEKDLNLMDSKEGEYVELAGVPCFVPYNLITQHSIPDKSVADCVEALIGAYLIECGPRGALLFMAWLGIRVLPKEEVILPLDHPFVQLKLAEMKEDASFKKDSKFSNLVVFEDPIDKDDQSDDDYSKDCNKETCEEIEQDPYDNQDENSDFDENDCWNWKGRVPGSLKPEKNDKGEWVQIVYGELKPPPSPLLRYVPDPEGELAQMLSGYDGLERTLGYQFKDRCYLLQAMTHASYSPNRLTDCYQRLEFLGDAVLDYLITRQLYEDPRRHSPGALTDLRSALVNNTIFASLAVRHGMHKYFRHLSPGLNEVLARFVKIQEENGHSISEEHYLIQEDECEQVEDVEVPKALGDLFESIAGAIFLDSGMSLDAVWKVYHALMKREIEAFSESVPKSPVRELLEMEPETAKFGKPEKLADGRRVRVTVEVLGVGVFKGVGRNYRIAKCTAAKCALRRLAPSANRRHKK